MDTPAGQRAPPILVKVSRWLVSTHRNLAQISTLGRDLFVNQNLSFNTAFGKAKGRLVSMADQKSYKLKNSATRGSRKHGAGVSTEGPRKPQNP